MTIPRPQTASAEQKEEVGWREREPSSKWKEKRKESGRERGEKVLRRESHLSEKRGKERVSRRGEGA